MNGTNNYSNVIVKEVGNGTNSYSYVIVKEVVNGTNNYLMVYGILYTIYKYKVLNIQKINEFNQ